ncbi:MAG: sodium:calcium antiporter [Candidatus Aenigmatarchaeota archaeon]
MVLVPLILFIIGVIVLAKSSNLVINKSIALMEITGLSLLTIGFAILAFGTSVPELAIGLISSVQGHPNISIGNVIGASIADILLILGISLVLGLSYNKIKKDEKRIIEKILISTIVIAIALILLGTVGLVFGFFCVVLFFILSSELIDKKHRGNVNSIDNVDKTRLSKIVILLCLGLILVVIAAKIVVDSAVELSEIFGLRESFLGVIIISLGTTLPELSVTLSAVRKKQGEIAIGNIAGSILFNMTFILGMVIFISATTIGQTIMIAAGFLILTNLFLIYMIRRGRLGVKEGVLMLLMYSAFIFAVTLVGA